MRLHQLTESPVTGDIIEFEFSDIIVECVYQGYDEDGDIVVETSTSNQTVISELNDIEIDEAEYQGKKVTLNKPIRTGKDEPKKFKVYVKDGDKVKMVRFGHQGKGNEKTMKIKKSDPERRKNFRARHNCDNPGPKTKARYWSCKAW